MRDVDVEKGRGLAPVRWRVTTPEGVRFACQVDVSGARVHVRLTTGHDNLVCARDVSSLALADTLAHRWLRALVDGDDIGGLIAGSRTDVVH